MFHGLEGKDFFPGSLGDDLFDGGPGTDTYGYDVSGHNTCISVERVVVEGACDA